MLFLDILESDFLFACVWAFEGKIVKKENVSPDLYSEVKRLGARDMEACMQCGSCASPARPER
jgi:heterodisulfide reductase subunit C